MTRVKCPCVECKHNKDHRCKNKGITLAWKSVMTVHEGRLEAWICKDYEMDEESKRIYEDMKRIMGL